MQLLWIQRYADTCNALSFHPAALLSQQYCLRSFPCTCKYVESWLKTQLCIFMAKKSAFSRRNPAEETSFYLIPYTRLWMPGSMAYWRKSTVTWHVNVLRTAFIWLHQIRHHHTLVCVSFPKYVTTNPAAFSKGKYLQSELSLVFSLIIHPIAIELDTKGKPNIKQQHCHCGSGAHSLRKSKALPNCPINFTDSVCLLYLESNSDHDSMTLNTLSSIPRRGVHKYTKLHCQGRAWAAPPAERALLFRIVAVGRIFDPWPSLVCSLGQEQGIVPPAPALLHIHTTRAESNKRRLRGIICLIWENQLIVWRHKQTMSRLWELGNGLLWFCMWCVHCWEREERWWGWIYPCEHACRPSSAWRRTFLHHQIFLLSRFSMPHFYCSFKNHTNC